MLYSRFSAEAVRPDTCWIALDIVEPPRPSSSGEYGGDSELDRKNRSTVWRRVLPSERIADKNNAAPKGLSLGIPAFPNRSTVASTVDAQVAAVLQRFVALVQQRIVSAEEVWQYTMKMTSEEEAELQALERSTSPQDVELIRLLALRNLRKERVHL